MLDSAFRDLSARLEKTSISHSSGDRTPWGCAGLRRSRAFSLVTAVGLTLLSASVAQALPVLNTITSGLVQVQVFLGDDVLLGATFTTAVSGTVVVDEAAQSLEALDITLGPDIPLTLSSAYGGYDNIVIETANFANGAGFSSTLISSTPSEFQVAVGPVDVSASWAGTDSSLVNPPASGVPFGSRIPSITSIFSNGLVMNGLALFEVDGEEFGEAEDLLVLANLNLTLSSEPPTPVVAPVPEPSTAMLIGLSLAGLAGMKGSRLSRG
jgi:hypothetical protein